MNEPIDAINWVRWLMYLLGGVPLLAWLLFTRDRVLRLFGVVAFLFLLQDNIVGRRYVFEGLSLAPSTGLAYVALLAEVLSQRRMPNMGTYLPLWLAFLFLAGSNILIGSIGTGLWALNFKQFQIFYLEGFLIFAYALIATRTDEDLLRYTRFLMLIGLAVAIVHIGTSATGFRFRNANPAYAELYYAGVLDNANSLGSLYSMWVPIGLSLAVGPRQPTVWRFATIASLALMLGSLILTGSRGGILFAVLTSFLAFSASRTGLGRALVATVVAAVGGLVGYFVLSFIAPEALRMVLGIAAEEGTKTDRFTVWPRYFAMLLDHPFGIGLAAANNAARVEQYGVPGGVLSAHNIYLDIALQTGLLGLGIFLAMMLSTLLSNRRAASSSSDPLQRDVLLYLFLPIVGFLGVGIFEPIYTISNKMNNLLWISCGLSISASHRILAARREAAFAAPQATSHPFGSPAPPRPS